MKSDKSAMRNHARKKLPLKRHAQPCENHLIIYVCRNHIQRNVFALRDIVFHCENLLLNNGLRTVRRSRPNRSACQDSEHSYHQTYKMSMCEIKHTNCILQLKRFFVFLFLQSFFTRIIKMYMNLNRYRLNMIIDN